MAERGLSIYADPEKSEHWRLRVVQVSALASLERFAERERVLQLVLPDSQKVTKPGVQFRLQQRPVVDMDSILEAERKLGLDDLLRRHRATLAIQLLNRDPKAGRAAVEVVLKESREAKDTRAYLFAAGNLGMFLADQFRLDEALRLLEETRMVAYHAVDTLTMAYADSNIGWLHQLMGQEASAIEAFTGAEKVFAKLGVLAEQRRALRNLGSIYYYRGEHQKAGEYFERARKLIQPESEKQSAAGLWSDLAANAIALGQTDAAELAIQSATGFEGHKEIFEYPWILLTQGKIIENRGGDPLPAYRQAAALTSRDHTATLEANLRIADSLRSSGRGAEAEKAYRIALEAATKLRTLLQQEDSKIGFASTVNRIYQDYVDLLVETGREREALEIADSSRLQVFSERGQDRSAKLDLRRAAANLRAAKTTALFYWLAPKRSFLWVIDGKGSRLAANLPEAAAIEGWVRQYDQFIQAGRDPQKSDFAPAGKLWSELVEKSGLQGLDRVVIVPDGALHWLNFETLPVGRTGRLWVEQARITVSPALRLVSSAAAVDAAGGGQRASGGGPAALLIGDPAAATKNFKPLAHAGSELQEIAKLYDEVRVLTQSQATPEAYGQAKPGQYDVIHFAAHAEANTRSPLDSAVILSPGAHGFRLFTRDTLQYPLRARLVTLSACSAAGAKAFAGEGLVGFSWAFLRTGARQVVAGLWKVDDESTPRLMRLFYEGMRKQNRTPPDALREAKLEMIRKGGSYAKPYYWAPFQLFTSALD